MLQWRLAGGAVTLTAGVFFFFSAAGRVGGSIMEGEGGGVSQAGSRHVPVEG